MYEFRDATRILQGYAISVSCSTDIKKAGVVDPASSFVRF